MTPTTPFLRGAMVLTFATGLVLNQPASAEDKDAGKKITLKFPNLPKDPPRTLWYCCRVLPRNSRPRW